MTQDLPILSPDRLDAAWMTRALRQAGHEAHLAGMSMESVGAGQVGDTMRFTLDYAGAVPAGAPRSVIGKFPAANAQSREAAVMFNIYRNETMFYRHLAATAGMRVPKPYLALFADETHDFIVLLEDLGHLRPGDQMAGCTLDETLTVVTETARLHASHWQDPVLLAADWVLKPDAAWGFYTDEIISGLWPGFVERYGSGLDADVFRVAEALVRNFKAWSAPRNGPRAITHNDLRPDNMLFGRTPDDPAVVVVDWQTMTLGTGAVDLAYFVGGALDRATRQAHEEEIMKVYYAELLARGVSGYSFADLVADYRHLSFVGAVMAIGASMLVKQTERGDRMFMSMLTHAAHHVLDLGALDVLPG